MFYAIDRITNEIILSINIRSENYKNSYNKSLRYKCAGCLDNGNNCNDDNVTFVNSIKKEPHFRHSKNTICSASKAFNEFNKDFYLKWFELFKKEYRKPYWFNINLEEISNNKNIIMIKYNHQIEKIIKNIESNVKKNNKILWILSLENRNFNSIKFYKGSIYIDFAGSKNDIPLYNSNKSIIYLDTGFNVLLKIKLENYNSNGQEIEIIYTKDFCKEYDELFIAYPYRKKYNYIDNILDKQNKYNTLDEQNKYNNYIKILLEEYNNIIKIIDEYDYICYNYYYNLYIEQQNIHERLIRQKIEKEWKDNKIFNMNEYRQNWAKIYNKI